MGNPQAPVAALPLTGLPSGPEVRPPAAPRTTAATAGSALARGRSVPEAPDADHCRGSPAVAGAVALRPPGRATAAPPPDTLERCDRAAVVAPPALLREPERWRAAAGGTAQEGVGAGSEEGWAVAAAKKRHPAHAWRAFVHHRCTSWWTWEPSCSPVTDGLVSHAVF